MLQYFDMAMAFAAVMLGVSVLVTALTQVVNMILGLRGKSLLWGLETLLTYIDADFKKHARQIADKILRHRLLSHTGGRRATAIRREEFVSLLEEVISQEDFARSIRAVEKQRRETATGTTENAEDNRFRFKAPAEYVHTLQTWFDRVMDRVSERFAMRARWVSVSFAVILAAAFHLDTIALLDRLAADSELRTSLVQSADLLLNHANEAFAASTNAYNDALLRLKASNSEAQRLGIPPEFFSAAAARDWIRAQIADSTLAATLIKQYGDLLDTVLREKIGRFTVVADSIRLDFSRARFALIPNPYPQWPYGWRDYAGMIISAILLSLGAPFWYNVLRNLANLRPRVADTIQREKREPRDRADKSPKTTAWQNVSQ